ncbi:hypothetical protein M9H77_08828 [Catharanthus roseus]|uniref:Uncharacterized protein n=1 Tax=Catharanthus roseus TaxID=4058 RepID=A0ACC0BZB7_CATRO|nr:hypothetical protein M9H77_08828 [Catharanthus roseus]
MAIRQGTHMPCTGLTKQALKYIFKIYFNVNIAPCCQRSRDTCLKRHPRSASIISNGLYVQEGMFVEKMDFTPFYYFDYPHIILFSTFELAPNSSVLALKSIHRAKNQRRIASNRSQVREKLLTSIGLDIVVFFIGIGLMHNPTKCYSQFLKSYLGVLLKKLRRTMIILSMGFGSMAQDERDSMLRMLRNVNQAAREIREHITSNRQENKSTGTKIRSSSLFDQTSHDSQSYSHAASSISGTMDPDARVLGLLPSTLPTV